MSAKILLSAFIMISTFSFSQEIKESENLYIFIGKKISVEEFNPYTKQENRKTGKKKNTGSRFRNRDTLTVIDQSYIGLGWHIITTKNNKEVFFHNGGTGGYSSSMTLNMEDNTAVIILSNVSSINESIDQLCFELLTQTTKK